MNYHKYKQNFYVPPTPSMNWTKKTYVEKAPIWCSVDLRDGNQSLITPMTLEEKLKFFKLLVNLGFKEIEIGFPAASDTEFEFCRTLIEQNLIPDDVTIQVLTQAREHIIRKTFDAIKGCKSAIVHLYNSTSVAQREQVFKKSKDEIIQMAIDGAILLKNLSDDIEGNFKFEYSPESFTGTEMEFALDICNAVIDQWQPTSDNKVIINLPVTVELSMPHVYASQVEYICNNINNRENVIISLHPHNDRGCGVADSEMGLLAGADRIEGTLFGNGERTGNVDIITLALNMFSQGIDPKLDFSNVPKITEIYKKITRMNVYERHPYSGQLVFAAFSGSHQDAIAKGIKWHSDKNCDKWTVPYLPIDPKDIGREYESDVIRINSQSGKGGIGYILEQNFGIILPPKFREEFGYHIKNISDCQNKELLPDEIKKAFFNNFVNISDKLKVNKATYVQNSEIEARLNIQFDKELKDSIGVGNGRLDAFSDAIMKVIGVDFTIVNYHQHALEHSSKSSALAYIEIKINDKFVWGVGMNTDIVTASVNAIISAVNIYLKQ